MESFVDRLASELELTKESILRLIDTFFRASWEDMRRLEEALASGDALGISHHAHDIKGAAAGLQFDGTRRVAEALEIAGRAGKLAEAPVLIASLRAELQRLQAERDGEAGIGSGT